MAAFSVLPATTCPFIEPEKKISRSLGPSARVINWEKMSLSWRFRCAH